MISGPLAEQIRDLIATGGPLRFDRYMELALFSPDGGYYATPRARIGRTGDFYTNVSVGRMFGRVLAEQFAEIDALLGHPERFSIVEQGANDGAFAADVLNCFRERHPELYLRTRWLLVEPFAHLRETQADTLSHHTERIDWVNNLADVAPFYGVHFTNEYADALPVRVFVRAPTGWLERHVIIDNGALAFTDLSPVETLPHELPANVPEGYLAEVRPAAAKWIQAAAARINRGVLLTVDYGFPREQLYAPWREQGTLAGYRDHRRDENPLDNPGNKDLTAHVDFTALGEAGQAADLVVAGFTDQYHFLVGSAEHLLRELETTPDSPQRTADLRALKSLLHPETMGTQFKYLALTRDLPSVRLSGFRYAREGLLSDASPP